MTRPLFTGWVKPTGGPWRRVAAADDYALAWRLTLAAPLAGGGERLVNDGRHPERRRKPR